MASTITIDGSSSSASTTVTGGAGGSTDGADASNGGAGANAIDIANVTTTLNLTGGVSGKELKITGGAGGDSANSTGGVGGIGIQTGTAAVKLDVKGGIVEVAGGAVGAGGTPATTGIALDIDGNTEIATVSGSTFKTSSTATVGDVNIAAGKILTISGAGTTDLNGTTTIAGDNTSIKVTSTGTTSLGAVAITETNSTPATYQDIDVDAGTVDATSISMTADKAGVVNVASDATFTVSGTTAILSTGADTGKVTLEGAGNVTLGATTVTGTGQIATLKIDSTGTNNVGALTLVGDNTDGTRAIIDANQSVTIASITADNKSGKIDVAADKTVTVSGTTTIDGDGTAGGAVILSGAGNVTLGATSITGATNAGELQVDSTGTNTVGALTLGGTSGTAAHALVDVNEDTTIASVAVTAAKSGQIDTLTAKTTTVSGAVSIEGNSTAAGSLETSGAGNLTVSGTTTITGATAAGTLQVDGTGTNSFAGIEFAGAAVDMAIADINNATTASSVTVNADKYGVINTATSDGDTFAATSTTIKSGATLDIIDGDEHADVTLGDLTISGGTLNLDSGGAAMDIVNVTSITTNTGIATVTADDDSGGTTDFIYMSAASGKDTIGTTLIYDGSKVAFKNADGSADYTFATGADVIDLNNTTDNSQTFTGDTSTETKTISANGKVGAANGLSLNANSNKTVDITGGTTVATAAQTIAAGNTLQVASGAAYSQNTGALTGNGTVALGGEMNIIGSDSTIVTLNTVGTSGKITGTKTTTVTNLNMDASEKLSIESGTVTLKDAAATVTADSSSTLSLDGASAGVAVLNLNNNDETVGTLSVSADKYGRLTATNDTLTVSNADIAGHLDVAGANITVAANGRLGISANTITYTGTAGNTLTISDGAYIDEQATAGDGVSHIEIDASAAAATATIVNSSTNSSNVLGLLDVTAGATGGDGAANAVLDNTGATDGALTIRTANVTANAGHADGDSTLTVQKSAGTKSNSVTIDTLNLYDQTTTSSGGTAKVVVSNDASLSIGTLNFKTDLAGELENNTTGTVSITNVVVDATTAGEAVTGTIDNVNTTGTVGITNATITGDATNAAKLFLDENAGGGADTFTVDTVTLAGDAAVGNATLEIDSNVSTATIGDVQVAAGKYGTITNGAADRVYKNATIAGTLAMNDVNYDLGDGTNAALFSVNNSDATAAGEFAHLDSTGRTIDINDEAVLSIGNKGKVTATLVDVSATTPGTAEGKLKLDFGTEAQSAGNYATVVGTVQSAGGLTATANQTASGVIGVNGLVGETYTTVFTGLNDNAGGAYGAGDKLDTEDSYRIYTLANATDVTVSTNTSGINSTVIGNGGATEGARAANYLVTNQANFNSEGNTFVQRLTALSGADFARGADETAGVEATTQTAQSAQLGVQQSVGAVKNQMTAFRQGALSSGMASSFSGGGATAALSDMADAETLADAYDAAGSGYTAAAEGTYKKVQVWVNGYGGFGEQGSDDDMTGYDFYNVGVMGGLDYAFAKELRVGALFGYTYNNTDLYEDRGESIDNVLRFGAYASYNWNNFFVDLTPTMGIHMIESKRNLITNGTTAKGDRTGIDFNITGTVGYTFVLPAEFMITPSYSLGYTMFYDPDYTETGAGAGNLSVDSFTSNSLVQDLGVKVGKLFCVSDTLSILPEAWGGWEVEYLNTGGDRNSTTASSIGSQSYSTSMNGMATHRGYWGAGMTALINDNISVFGRYDHKIWDKGYNVGFTAGVKVAF